MKIFMDKKASALVSVPNDPLSMEGEDELENNDEEEGHPWIGCTRKDHQVGGHDDEAGPSEVGPQAATTDGGK